MADLAKLKVVVAGAGVVGAAAALRLAERGAEVTLADPAAAGRASSVAAGMLAPVFESVLGAEAPDLTPLLLRGRLAWDALVARLGLEFAARGALALGTAAEIERWRAAATAGGFEVRPLSAGEVAASSPDLAAPTGGLLAPLDVRLDPTRALAALNQAGATAGVRRARTAVTGFANGGVSLSSGQRFEADALVIATGAGRGLVGLAPELAALSPIKGHILRAQGYRGRGPVLRSGEIYVCPDTGGAIVGASMEAGRDDDAVEAEIVSELRAAAVAALPALASVEMTASTGVRAATADGLPLVGQSKTPGVWLATGVRRNGWLLAPVIADLLADGFGGGAGEPALAPARSA